MPEPDSVGAWDAVGEGDTVPAEDALWVTERVWLGVTDCEGVPGADDVVLGDCVRDCDSDLLEDEVSVTLLVGPAECEGDSLVVLESDGVIDSLALSDGERVSVMLGETVETILCVGLTVPACERVPLTEGAGERENELDGERDVVGDAVTEEIGVADWLSDDDSVPSCVCVGIKDTDGVGELVREVENETELLDDALRLFDELSLCALDAVESSRCLSVYALTSRAPRNSMQRATRIRAAGCFIA